MHALVRRLFPIARSITGDGVRETLRILQEHIPLTIHEVPSGRGRSTGSCLRSGTSAMHTSWMHRGDRVVDFHDSNLHVVGYSTPMDATLTLAELQEHLHSIESQPDAIPYVTSYYERRWGFCLSHAQRQGLQDGQYRVVIDSELKDGSLTYGELIIPGETDEEVFLSTYVCHPSMANNELSGPVVTTWLAKWIASRPRRYTLPPDIHPRDHRIAGLPVAQPRGPQGKRGGGLQRDLHRRRSGLLIPTVQVRRHARRPGRRPRPEGQATGFRPLLVPRPRQRRAAVLQPGHRPSRCERDAYASIASIPSTTRHWTT